MSGTAFLGNLSNLISELGLSALSTQSPASVAITGGAINGTSIGLTAPSSASFTTINASGNFTAAGALTVAGAATFSSTLSVSGIAQNTTALNTAGALGGSLVLKDVGAGGGAGGAVIFGANQGSFAAIKGLLTNGGTNTQGNLSFLVRTNATDATLTLAAYIDPGSNLYVTGAASSAGYTAVGTNAQFAINDRTGGSDQGIFYRSGGVNRLYDTTSGVGGDIIQYTGSNISLIKAVTAYSTLAVNGILSFPSTAGTAGTTNKITLYGGFGFGISPSSLDYVVPGGNAHTFYGNVVLNNTLAATGSITAGAVSSSAGISAAGSMYIGNNAAGSTNKLYLSGAASGANAGDLNHYIYSTGGGGNTMFFGEYSGAFNFYNTATSVSDITFRAGAITAISLTTSGLITATGGINIPGVGTNGLYPGNGDGASYTVYDLNMKLWWGLGMTTYDGSCHGYYDARSGIWDTQGGYKVNGTSVIDGSRNIVAANVTTPGTVTAAQLTSTNNINASGTITAAQLTSTNNISATGTVTAAQITSTGNVTAAGLIQVAGAVTINSNQIYTASGALYLQYSNTTGGMNICLQGGTTSLGGPLAVTGASTFTGTATFNQVGNKINVQNSNDAGLQAHFGQSFGYGWLGLSNVSGTAIGSVPANSSLNHLAWGPNGKIGTVTNTGFANGVPIFRNILDDGAGSASVAGTLTVVGQILNQGPSPNFRQYTTGNGTDLKYLEWYNDSGGSSVMRFVNDAYTSGPPIWTVNRGAGAVPTVHNFFGTSFSFAGAIYGPGSGVSIIGPGSSSAGYLEFRMTDGVRRGYIGYSQGANLVLNAENGWGWFINGAALQIGTSLTVTGNITLGGTITLNGNNQLNSATGALYIQYSNAGGVNINAGGGLLTTGRTDLTAGLTMYDAGGRNYWAGIVTEAQSQLIDFGINFSQLVTANTSTQGGFFRVDARGAYPLFQWNGGNGGTQIASLDNAGNFSASSVIASSQYFQSNRGGAQFVAPGYMHYSDGSNYYLLLTGTQTPTPTFNGLRPFNISLSTGYVGMGNGLSVTGGLTADNITVTGTFKSPGTAKAWVIFNNQGTISGSFGVSSVTVTSGGYYTINFPSGTFPDTNYAYASAVMTDARGVVYVLERDPGFAKTATAIQFTTVYSNSGYSGTSGTPNEMSIVFYHT